MISLSFTKILLLNIIINVCLCDSYNILGIVGWPSFSHQRAFADLWRQLSLKGHHVTVITTDPLREKGLVNLTEIDIGQSYEFLEKKYDWSRSVVNGGSTLLLAQQMMELRVVLAEIYFKVPSVQALINDRNQHFDVVLVEWLFPECLIFGEIFNAPTISISSVDPTSSTHERFGNPWNPIVYPSVLIPYSQPYDFLSRVKATVITFLILYKEIDKSASDQILAKTFPNNTVTLNALLEKTSFHFTAVNPMLLTSRPHSPRYVVIGGNTRMQETHVLDKDVQRFLDEASDGFIYFSLGSNVKAELIGEHFVESVANVLKQLPYKVLWKTMDTSIKVSPNVKIVKWAPQRYVLTHPNIKLFVTQGGIQSLEEAVLGTVPMVGVPIFADQEYNVNRLIRHGIIKRVGFKESNFQENLKAAMLEVFQSKQFKNNIIQFKELSLDQPISGTKKAMWYIDYTIRRKGNVSHLDNIDFQNVSWFQYFLLDVFLFLLCLGLALICGVYMLALAIRKLVLVIIYGKPRHDKTE